jgi:hypothetical protein
VPTHYDLDGSRWLSDLGRKRWLMVNKEGKPFEVERYCTVVIEKMAIRT